MKNSLKVKLSVVHDGVERTLVAGPAAIVAFERHYGIGFANAHAEGRVEHSAWLAHRAAWEEATAGNGPAVKPFDKWLEALEDIGVSDEDDEDDSEFFGTP